MSNSYFAISTDPLHKAHLYPQELEANQAHKLPTVVSNTEPELSATITGHGTPAIEGLRDSELRPV